MVGTPSQQQLGKKFFDPFINWPDDTKLREWLREQDPDELEQFLEWFDFTNHRDREKLGHQELRKLRSPTAKLGRLLGEGRALLAQHEPVRAHDRFGDWVNKVAKWLETELADPALSAAWSGLPHSALVSGGGYFREPRAWAHFQEVVTLRLKWLGENISSPREVRMTRQSVSSGQSRKVFIVHGHDEAARLAVASFLQKIGLEAIFCRNNRISASNPNGTARIPFPRKPQLAEPNPS